MEVSLRSASEEIQFDFSPYKTEYEINVSANYSNIQIGVSANNSTIKINGEERVGNTLSLSFSNGSVQFIVEVTSSDNFQNTYYFTITNLASSTGICRIEIDGFEKKIDFIPISAQYNYNYVADTIQDIPTIEVTVYKNTNLSLKAYKSSISNDNELSISNNKISNIGLVEGINTIVLALGTLSNNVFTTSLTYYLNFNIKIEDRTFINNIDYKGSNYAFRNIDKVYKYCTVEIDLTNSNSATCCTYKDSAVLFEKGSDDWNIFFGHYPVVFKEGKEIKRVNPNNFKQDIFGNTISASDGDIMIKFPRRGINIYYKDENTLVVSMTNNPNDTSYTYYAHNVGLTQKDAFYLGAYKLSLDNVSNSTAYININTAKARSVSGFYVEKGSGRTNVKIPNEIFRYYCENNNTNNNGNGLYRIEHVFQRTFLQVMYILKYANLNSQATIGAGLVNASSMDLTRDSAYNKTGYADEYGMDNEFSPNKDDDTKHMKLFGIEDLWGNAWEYIFGFYLDKSYADKGCISTTYDYNYMPISEITNYYTTSAIKKPLGFSDFGFIIKETGTSYSNYFCDSARIINPSDITSNSGIIREVLLSNNNNVNGNRAGIFTSDISEIISNLNPRNNDNNIDWINAPRFEKGIFTSQENSTSTIENESDFNYSTAFFTCNASSTNTARLMYL